MLTIFSTAKPFDGHFGVIQRNALSSWAALAPEVEVILFGDEAGIAATCEDFAFVHMPAVERSPQGTPLISDMFEQAAAVASSDVLCFVNADVILGRDVLSAIDAVKRSRERFLLVAQRYDIQLDQPVDLRRDDAREAVRTRARAHGRLMPPIWIDWFVFPRNLFSDLPEFAIGRSGYDNYLIWRAADLGAEVVDCTDAVLLVHQSHDYSHGGGKAAVWEGAEARRAAELVGDWRHYHSVAHATLRLTADGQVVRARGGKYAMARPRQLVGHLLRFARPLRRRWHGERSSRYVNRAAGR